MVVGGPVRNCCSPFVGNHDVLPEIDVIEVIVRGRLFRASWIGGLLWGLFLEGLIVPLGDEHVGVKQFQRFVWAIGFVPNQLLLLNREENEI